MRGDCQLRFVRWCCCNLNFTVSDNSTACVSVTLLSVQTRSAFIMMVTTSVFAQCTLRESDLASPLLAGSSKLS